MIMFVFNIIMNVNISVFVVININVLNLMIEVFVNIFVMKVDKFQFGQINIDKVFVIVNKKKLVVFKFFFVGSVG